MNKGKKIIKSIVSIIIILNIIFDTFGVAVSDNDGSAFITKAEFDSLKNNFQSQIDSYNSNIDNKIDNAVGSYLAGIKVDTEYKLNNIFEELGGYNIKYGNVDLEPKKAPKTGYGYYTINSGNAGYAVGYAAVGYRAIPEGFSTNWGKSGVSGSGSWGKFLKYSYYDNNKYLISYEESMLQAIYLSAWYSSSNHANITVNYPFGNGPRNVLEQLTPGTVTHTDVYTSFYRHVKKDEKDLTWFSFCYDVPYDNDIYLISDTNILKASGNSTTYSNQSRTTYYNFGYNVYTQNILVYDWDYEQNKSWKDLSQGYMYKTLYNTPLYGGVPFFSVSENGEVEISNLEFSHYDDINGYLATGNVYFAIQEGEFENESVLSGNCRLKNLMTEHIVNGKYYYEVPINQKQTFKLDVNKGKTYYVKCQYSTSRESNINKYVQIKNGTNILLRILK